MTALTVLFCSAVVAETNWPTKPITLVCGYSAGGSSDLGCRYLAAALEKQLGVPVVVENRPGSGSWVAWNRFLHNTPTDGNTFALVNLSAVFGHYDDKTPRKETIDDFELLANQAIDYQVIAIRPDEKRFTDYKSFLEYAKNNELLTAASSTGITSGEASVARMLEKFHGAKVSVVPVGGAGDANTMFISGNIDFLIGNVGDVTLNPENYKVIVLFANERDEQLPDVPTEKELGLGDYVSFFRSRLRLHEGRRSRDRRENDPSRHRRHSRPRVSREHAQDGRQRRALFRRRLQEAAERSARVEMQDLGREALIPF